MGAKLFLTDAIVIAKGEEPAVKVKTSPKTGEKTASFAVGVKKYDPSYTNNVRYNNYFIFVPTHMVETVARLNLKRKSMVHIIADQDYTKDVLTEKEQQGDINAVDYGISRMVNGVFCKLIDIEFAGTTSNIRTTTAEALPNDESEPIRTKSVEKSNGTHDTTTIPISIPETSALPTHPLAMAVENERGALEKEMGIEIIDLDEKDIFGTMFQKREKRKFF